MKQRHTVAWLLGAAAVLWIATGLPGQQPTAEPPPPPSFFVQDLNRWQCVLEGEGIADGKLPTKITCSHSKTKETVVYLPQKAPIKKEEKK